VKSNCNTARFFDIKLTKCAVHVLRRCAANGHGIEVPFSLWTYCVDAHSPWLYKRLCGLSNLALCV